MGEGASCSSVVTRIRPVGTRWGEKNTVDCF